MSVHRMTLGMVIHAVPSPLAARYAATITAGMAHITK